MKTWELKDWIFEGVTSLKFLDVPGVNSTLADDKKTLTSDNKMCEKYEVRFPLKKNWLSC